MMADCPFCKKTHVVGEGAVPVSHAEVCAAWGNWVIYKQVTGWKLPDADLHNFIKLTGWCAYASGNQNFGDLSVYVSPEQADRIRWMGGTHGVTLLKAYAAKYPKKQSE